MSESGETLILFTRYPRAGAVKTRLIPALGAEGATLLHRRLVAHALDQAQRLARIRSTTLEIHHTGGARTKVAAWLGRDLVYRSQGEGDLGARMDRAFATAFRTGTEAAIIMGSDCPDLTAEVLIRAFDMLVQNDLVLGPAGDGGYYLIGLSRRVPELFADIPWGSDAVLDFTLRHALQLGLAHAMLATLDDVDRPEDLERARAFLPTRPLS
jgi:rSAM/selenodomain-associated transferase 1